MKLHLLPAAALLLASVSSVHAQTAGVPTGDANPSPRLTLSVAVGRPAVRISEAIGSRVEGANSIRAAASYALRMLELGVAYERSGFDAKYTPDVASTLQTVSATVAVLAAPDLRVRPFLEVGPALVIFHDGRRRGDLGGTDTGAGATAEAGVRVRLAGPVGARAAVSALIAEGGANEATRVFTGVNVGLTLGL